MDVLSVVQGWFDLLDWASEKGVSDKVYLQLADRFTAWMGILCPQETQPEQTRSRCISLHPLLRDALLSF